MFLNLLHGLKMKIDVIESLLDPKSSTWWLKPWLWYTSIGEEGDEKVDAMTLFPFEDGIQLYGKTMETLTLKKVFIGFLIGLKWLEPKKGLVHLI